MIRPGRSYVVALLVLTALLWIQPDLSALGEGRPKATAKPSSNGSQGAAGSQLWVSRYDDFRNGADRAFALAVSPDGSRVFVAGYSGTIYTDFGTVAYDAVTGDRLWVRRYDGTGHGFDQATSLAVSPDGSTVFVSGFSSGPGGDYDYATVAYQAATGIELWVTRYDGPANYYDYAFAMAASPDGSMVVVTGYTTTQASGDDYATVAYDAETGAQLWVATFNGTGNSTDAPFAIGITPDSGLVFVTGNSYGPSDFDYVTIAYEASTGKRIWASRYVGPGGDGDAPTSLAVSPDGTKLFVTGHSWGSTSMADYATVAYEAATGHRLWTARYNGPGNDSDIANDIAISADGGEVFVTGTSRGSTTGNDYATIAYDASSGQELWGSRYSGPRSTSSYDFGTSLGLSPDGTEVYVTGYSRGSGTGPDFATLAYDASGGTRLWLDRYDGPGHAFELTPALAVGPDGSRVFVSGPSQGAGTDYDYATIAYAAKD